MVHTYAECIAQAQQCWGEEWYKHCQIVWTNYARARHMWVVRGKSPSRFALRRVS